MSYQKEKDFLDMLLAEYVDDYYWAKIESSSAIFGRKLSSQVDLQGYSFGVYFDVEADKFMFELTLPNGESYTQALEDDEFEESINYISDYDIITFETIDRAVMEIQERFDGVYICIEESEDEEELEEEED